MKRVLPGSFLPVLLLVAALLAGCGRGGGGAPTPTPSSTTTPTPSIPVVPTPTSTATPAPPPNSSVQGTWKSVEGLEPPVAITVGDYLGSRDISSGGLIMTFHFYAGEIQCPVYPGGVHRITAIPPEGSFDNYIYAMTVSGQSQKMLSVVGTAPDTLDKVEFNAALSDANTAQGVLVIQDGGETIWYGSTSFNRS